jgi:ribosomal protein L14
MGVLVGTNLVVGDNSGVLVVRCIKVLCSRDYGFYGDIVVVVVKRFVLFKRQFRFQRGSICRALIVNLKVNFRRSSGVFVRFSDNVVILVNSSCVPIGSRVRVPILHELCERFPFLGTISRCII